MHCFTSTQKHGYIDKNMTTQYCPHSVAYPCRVLNQFMGQKMGESWSVVVLREDLVVVDVEVLVVMDLSE